MIVTVGTPYEVITPAMLQRVFGVEANIVTDPRLGVPLCIPYGLAAPTPGEPTKGTPATNGQPAMTDGQKVVHDLAME